MPSAQDVVQGNRLEFTALRRSLIAKVMAAEPFGGQCPCGRGVPVLTRTGRTVPGAEYDHFVHRGLSKPEHGWLVCAACHAALTYGGYLVRFAHIPEFRAFQAAVLEQGRKTQARAGAPPA